MLNEQETDLEVTAFDDEFSSLIAAASYTPGQELLIVEMRDGRKFLYGGVPQKVWLEFRNATSRGAYFNRCIRPMYEAKPLEDPPDGD